LMRQGLHAGILTVGTRVKKHVKSGAVR
jgi:hypothetical protein